MNGYIHQREGGEQDIFTADKTYEIFFLFTLCMLWLLFNVSWYLGSRDFS